MSDSPRDFLVTPAVLQTGAAVLTAILGITGGILAHPQKEESRLNSLRNALLASLRFKVAYEMAGKMPRKEIDMSEEDYLAVFQDQVSSYLSSSSTLLVDLVRSESLFHSATFWLRALKYGLIFLFVVGLTLFFLVPLVISNAQGLLYYVITFLSLVFLGVLLIFMKEKKRDEYQDICSRHEVTVD